MSQLANVLVTTDFSDCALAAVEQAGEISRLLGSELTLLYVVEDHLPPILGGVSEEGRQDILERHRAEAEARLAAYAAEHLPGGRVYTVAVVGVASREIVHYAAEHEHDLIVMATHGWGPIAQILLGSTTERVLHHAPCPVLLVRSNEE